MTRIATDAIQQVHDYWIDLSNRELWVHGIELHVDGEYDGKEPGVEFMMATRVIKNLHVLRKQSKTRPVIMHLHTCGGVWEEGMAVYDTVKLMPFHVTIISYTHARSMSSLILQAGDTRLLMPSSYFMFHRGTLDVSGETKTVYSNVDYNRYCDRLMTDIYLESAMKGHRFRGRKKATVRRALKDAMDRRGDVFLTAEEAIDWGFADGLVTEWPNTTN